MLAATPLTDGRWAVASARALYVLAQEAVRRWPWAELDHGSLDDEGRLEVRLVSGSSFELTLLVGSARGFAAAFRERVQASVVHATHVTVPGGGHVQVAVRRDEDGRLFTQVLGDARADLSRPETARLVDEAEQRLREAVGLPQ